MFEAEILEIAQTIWESLIHLPVEPAPAPPEIDGASALRATISFSGAWEGQVHATMSAKLGRRLAAATLQTSASDLLEEDTQDVLKELINMLGGNIKALLPPPCKLSLPQVASVSSTESGDATRTVEDTVHLACDREGFSIRLSAGPSSNPPRSS
jgi:chemotaxis protein CheX